MDKLFKKSKFQKFLINHISYDWIEYKIKELLEEDFSLFFNSIVENEKLIVTNYKDIIKDKEKLEKVKAEIKNELIARMEDFDLLINQHFYKKIKFEKQGELFIGDVKSIIGMSIQFLERSNSFYLKPNEIQKYVLKIYLNIYNEMLFNLNNRFKDFQSKNDAPIEFDDFNKNKKSTNSSSFFKEFYNKEELSLKLLIESENEIDNFSDINILEFCVNESERILKDLKYKEIELKFTQFSIELQRVLYKLKNAINICSDSNKANSKYLLNSLNVLRDKIDSEFRHNHSSIIDWHKPSMFEKFFSQSNIKPENKSLDFILNHKKVENDFDKDIFKNIVTYQKFIEYTRFIKEDFIPEYSYLFQKMLALELIHKKKHNQYKEWLFNNKFINQIQLQQFIDRNSFESLKNLESAKRLQMFESIFDKNEKS